MKRFLLILPLAFALALSACGPLQKAGDFVAAATQTIVNPVTPTNIHQVELAFNIAIKASNRWADYCWRKPYKQLMTETVASRICVNRRATRRALFDAAKKADVAIKLAEGYIRDNPTISPLAAIGDAWKAVVSYRDMVAQIQPPA